jgi:hypothetical protein
MIREIIRYSYLLPPRSHKGVGQPYQESQIYVSGRNDTLGAPNNFPNDLKGLVLIHLSKRFSE